jgi:hypothetical protein
MLIARQEWIIRECQYAAKLRCIDLPSEEQVCTHGYDASLRIGAMEETGQEERVQWVRTAQYQVTGMMGTQITYNAIHNRFLGYGCRLPTVGLDGVRYIG